MKNKVLYKALIDSLIKFRLPLIVFVSESVITFIILYLYSTDLEPFCYASALGLFFMMILFISKMLIEVSRQEEINKLKMNILSSNLRVPKSKSISEKAYQEMIFVLNKKLNEITISCEKEKTDTQDYITKWVHQIKTPISVIKMSLNDDADNTDMQYELFRIEQYVDMVLQYIRLGSQTNDLVIREYKLDELVRRSIRKYATQFIRRKLPVNFEDTGITIITDEKWFSCIIEQLLSNSVKYTPSGEISVFFKDNKLYIKDTGIGIAPEDLPRIFEKGYTGLNGRTDKYSSGLGLYLAKSASEKLSIRIEAQSKVGEGTQFILDLENSIA